MARKKIGLFMSEITQFFQESFGKEVGKLARERNMDVVIYASFGSYPSPYGRNLLSEIGKKNIIHLPDYSAFDAIIVLPNTFDIYGMDTEFYNLVKKDASCPIICIQSGSPDFYTVTIENRDTMYQMTKHFIDVHGFTDICYMSGPFNSKDSPDRLKGFTEAMDEAGLKIRPNTIYEGNYWRNRGAKAVDFFLDGRQDYPQAIICANDYMALSICDELKKRGKRVPEDVCVCGFDGIREGEINKPSLTTVTIKPESYAEAAFRLIDDIDNGKEVEKVVTLSDEIIFRASCGCGREHATVIGEDVLKRAIENEYLLRESGRITADYQNNFELDNALSVANYYFGRLGCSTGYLCLCDEDEDQLRSVERNNIYSDDMILMQIMQSDQNRKAETVDMRFPRAEIIPEEFWNTEKPSIRIVLPLYFKNKEYGYLVLDPAEGQWPNAMANTYISTLSSAIENSYYQEQFIELAEIKRISQTDPLTGLLNRRGFENGLQEILSSWKEGVVVSIASIDMDNLKLINDIYGHTDGDFALTTLAKVLDSCIDEGEICARFGGDEFSAVLVSDRPGHVDEFVKLFGFRLSEASRSSGKPYPIHASVGICDLKGGDTKQIFTCMQVADERMYVNKRNYKKTQK